jgi:DNA-binding SARP family transcriptional activator
VEPGFRLRLFGYPLLTALDGRHVTGLGPGKPLALLAYLAVRREARRDELVDLLWGEAGEANARNAFRQALHRLRTAIGETIIPMDRDRVELSSGAGLESDRDSFLQALDRGDIPAAVDAYRGDFLEGFELNEPAFDSWVDAERTRLKSRFQVALQNGAESALATGRWLEALQYVQRLTSVAPYDEGAALLEANVLVAAGRGSEAIRTLRRFAQTLHDQLDLQASPKVRETLARLERAEPAREATLVARPKEISFVGRELEIATMMSAARELATERGATIFVAGPAGIGKSRLVTEFLRRARAIGPLLVLRGRERPTNTALPYASIAEALRGALRAPGVAGTGRHLLAEASRILPDLRDSFDLPEPPPIDAEGGRLRFFEGIAALLDSAAYEQPVCIVIDDVQHASASTVDMIGYLSARLQSSPVLIVLIQRDLGADSPVARLVNDAEGEPHVIRVGPMSDEAVRRLVEEIVGTATEAGPLDVDRVVAAAGGSPVRAIELSRRALDGELPSAIPVSLRDILWSRLQKASPSQRRVFFAAALLQRPASLRLLAAAAHLPEATAFEAAQALEQSDLLAPDGGAYVLAHDFTTSFVVELSGPAGRSLLAGWAADALAAEIPAAHAELASLHSLAGQQAKAFDHAQRAVYHSAVLGDTPELNRLLTLALALAPDADSRARVERLSSAFGAGKRLLGGGGDPIEQAQPLTENIREPAPQPPAVAMPEAPPDLRRDVVPDSRPKLFTPRLAALVIAGVILSSAAVAVRQKLEAPTGPNTLLDSLVVVNREDTSEAVVITGALADLTTISAPAAAQPPAPDWFRMPSLPWIRPSVSPTGDAVAMEKVTATGTDIFLADSVSPVPVVIGGGIDAVLGWAPDGGALLVRRAKVLSDGAFDADLWVYWIRGRQFRALPIDTSSGSSVEEAAWSPDGTRIAWVAQVGSPRQRDVFVSRADGGAPLGVTNDPAEDYHISWSSDGNLLAFTSDRGGNADLFALELDRDTRRLWRLTKSAGDEDLARFSPDSRFVAYQSTAAGDAAVYIMPALGGAPTRATPVGGQYSLAGWRGRARGGFIDRFRIIGPASARVGDSIRVSLFVTERNGSPRTPDVLQLRMADSSASRLLPVGDTTLPPRVWTLRAERRGTIRLVAAIPGWRFDTLDIVVGDGTSEDFGDDFLAGISSSRWRVRGSPSPFARESAGRAVLFPNGDLEWPSGLLGRQPIALGDSLSVSATFIAPFDGAPSAAAMLTLALISEDRAQSIDSLAPQAQPLVSIVWDGEAARFNYSVGTESRSDPISVLGSRGTHDVCFRIDPDGRVQFYVDERLRWSSSLRFLGATGRQAAYLWVAGQATADRAGVRDLRVIRRR